LAAAPPARGTPAEAPLGSLRRGAAWPGGDEEAGAGEEGKAAE
jgi:hypothetical protein